jgi:hypothetical protein
MKTWQRYARIERRTFLKGAAGALSLPLLHAMRAPAAPSDLPKRLVLFYNPNGTIGENWFPSDAQSETEFTLPPILEPFAAHRDKLVILKGINTSVGQDPMNNGGPHQRGIGSLFTGQMLLEGEFADGCGSKAGWADGPSIDQLVAQQIGEDTPFRSLELGVRANSNDVQGRIVYAGSGAPLPPTNDPRELYRRLFFREAPLDPENPDNRRKSILDTVKAQYSELNGQVGQEDRRKLEQHLSLVEDLERRLGLQPTPGSGSCEAPAEPDPLAPDDENTMPAISRSHLDLLAHAFACDLTRVASVQYSTGFNRIRFPWLDTEGEGHSLSHSGNSNVEAIQALTARARWHAGEIAYFLDRLAEIPEGEGTVLDNTLVLWGNEVSRGNSHALDDIPYLICGNAGGAVRTGRFLQYSSASNCDFLHAILQAFGVELDRFGHPAHSNGVLSNLLT